MIFIFLISFLLLCGFTFFARRIYSRFSVRSRTKIRNIFFYFTNSTLFSYHCFYVYFIYLELVDFLSELSTTGRKSRLKDVQRGNLGILHK